MIGNWMPPLEGTTEREKAAIDALMELGNHDGAHHKNFAMDQVLRILTDCPTVRRKAKDYRGNEYEYDDLGESPEYLAVVAAFEDGEEGPQTYEWDTGIAP